MTTHIITRHKGAIEWLEKKGYKGEISDTAVVEKYKKGDAVIGVLPIHIICELEKKGVETILIQMPTIPPEARGKEITPEDMDKYGAKLLRIKKCECEEV